LSNINLVSFSGKIKTSPVLSFEFPEMLGQLMNVSLNHYENRTVQYDDDGIGIQLV
jgi:hypothetical protein